MHAAAFVCLFLVATPVAAETEAAVTVMPLIRARVPALGTCARKRLGHLVVSFTVIPAGAVTELKVSRSSFAGGDVDACVEKQVAAWVFTALPAPAGFELPIYFTKEGSLLADTAAGNSGALLPDWVSDAEVPISRAQQIQTVVQSQNHKNELNDCYIAGLTRKPDLAGKVVLRFRILASGQVRKARVKTSTLRDDLALACIVAAARAWTFPPTGSVANVEFPFLFPARR